MSARYAFECIAQSGQYNVELIAMDWPVLIACHPSDNVMLSQPQRRSIWGGAGPPIPRFLPPVGMTLGVFKSK